MQSVLVPITPRGRLALAGLAVLALLTAVQPAAAQDDQLERAREALRRATGDLRTLEQQNAVLQAQLAQAQAAATAREAEAKQLAGRVTQLERQVTRLTTRGEQLQQAVDETTAQLEATSADLDRTQGRLGRTEGELASTEAARAAAQADLELKTGLVAACQETNARLYDVGREILAAYENKDLGDVLAQDEPFTGLKSVEIENIVQDYQDKLLDERLRSQNN
jgi:chromosome segregation ATPase